jgi:putative tryptophan/tyrosine transport system substrate-binding protein
LHAGAAPSNGRNDQKREGIAMAKKKRKKKTKLLAHDVGIIHSGTSGRHDARIKAFKDGMALFTNVNPRNPRWAKDHHATLDTHATALVNDGVTVLVAAGGSRSAIAAMRATTQTPIIVTSISNSARPAPNVAGICVRTTQSDPDRLELLLQLLPGRTKIGALYDPSRPDASDQKNLLDSRARVLGIEPLDWQPVDPNGSSQEAQIDDAFRNWGSNIEAIIVTADPLFNNHIGRIVKTAGGALRTIPAIYQWREFAEAGGLISYGPDLTLAYKLAGTFVGRIVSNDTTVDKLPLLPLSGFELVINLRTAKTLNIPVPSTLLARATDVIV